MRNQKCIAKKHTAKKRRKYNINRYNKVDKLYKDDKIYNENGSKILMTDKDLKISFFNSEPNL